MLFLLISFCFIQNLLKPEEKYAVVFVVIAVVVVAVKDALPHFSQTKYRLRMGCGSRT